MRRSKYGLRQFSSLTRTRLAVLLGGFVVLAGHGPGRVAVQAQASSPCGVGINVVVCENQKPGNPASEWDVTGSGDPTIQGFATDISVNVGGVVQFKVDTDAVSYHLDIYRMGYYDGLGARQVASVVPSATLPQAQDPCLVESATGLIDCGNWAVSASWTVPADAASGIYFARAVRTDTGGASHILFIVREDARHSDLLFQTSDTTWQAYNNYGGNSLYVGQPAGRAYKVSYNRPLIVRATPNGGTQSNVFNAEYPMVRWLEANGYDVAYSSGVDSDRRGALIKDHKAFLSVGHDEYWSGVQRANVEAARDAGVNLAFFSGNEVFWKTRWENSVDGSNTAYRTLVSYKETHANAKIDPSPEWTGTWRDPRFSPPADGGRPENALTGTMFTVNCCSYAITVPGEMAAHRFWRNTSIAALQPGSVATLSANTLGYEWDEDLDNGFRPAGLTRLSSTTVAVPEHIQDHGSNYAPGVATHSLTLYRKNTIDPLGNPKTALVFGGGTVQWSWGLDGNHDRGSSIPDVRMQQATVNLFADMGAQPGTLQVDLVPATASTDTVAPTSTITSPVGGATVESGVRVTVSGTAADTGGAVGGVEVSVDGGVTWHAAHGTSPWTYDWFPEVNGPATISSRATDDSGNIGDPSAGVLVTVVGSSCPPCTSLWNAATTVPGNVDSGDTNAVELGVKFTSEVDGFITGVRFYKSIGNTGTHVGNLWTSGGTLLRTGTFTNETAVGWQFLRFTTPVPVLANTTYVASYHTNVGHYSADRDYFATMGINSPPLHAPAGDNGIFTYGVSAFPQTSFLSTNYWVDVDFAETIIDVELAISQVTASALDGSTAVITWRTNDDADSRVDYSTNPAFPPAETLSVTDPAFVLQHSATLFNLTTNATYYFRITSISRTGSQAQVMPPSFTMPGPTLHDTASVDFLGGTQGTTCDQNGANCVVSTYVAENGNGEVTLAPQAGAEFTGSSLPSGWLGALWQPPVGGSFSVEGGHLIVDGARVGTCDAAAVPDCESGIYGPGRSLEFVATFTGDPFQHAGFGIKFEDLTSRAVFSTDEGGVLKARTFDGSGNIMSTTIGTGLLGLPHLYRIDWTPVDVKYFVDGALLATHAGALAGPMRPVAASDYNPFGGNVIVNWMRMKPYAAASGSFFSRVFDAHGPVNWKTITWQDVKPAGTSLTLSVRTGDTPTPDGSWTAFVPVAAPGPFTASSQYIQYRADLTTTDLSQTPELTDIVISTDEAPVAVDDVATTNDDTPHIFRPTGPTSLTINDTDADTPHAQLRVVGVTAPAHGSLVLLTNGQVTYTPVTGFVGNDSFTYTVTDGLLTDIGTASITVGTTPDENHPPVANDGSLTTAEDTTANGTLSASDADLNPLTYSIVVNGTMGTATVTNAATGAYSYVPNANANGTDTFTFKANDGQADSNVATVIVTITPVNDAPVASDGTLTTAEDTTANGTLSASDVELSALTYSVVVNGTKGTATVTNAATGAYSYVPNANANGADTFTFKANDGQADSNVATVAVTITPVNDAPVANAQSVSTAEDTAKAITLTGSDVDLNTLTYSVVTGPTRGALSGTAPNLTYTPAANYHGPDSFTFKVNDGTVDSAPATVTITVTPVFDTQAGLVLALGFDEASGNALDASGQGNVATLSGATRVSGVLGNALQFDGVNDIATVADAASLDLTTGMTLEAWIRPETISTWETVLIKETGPDTFSYLLYARDDGAPSGNVRAQGGHRTIKGGYELPVGAWTHLATTYDGVTQRLFIDGVEVSSRSQTGAIETGNGVLHLGGNDAYGGEFYKGAMDDVRIYNRALSAAEITADIADAVPPLPPLATPVLKLNFDEASGDALDSSGFGHIATLQGAVRVAGVRGNAVQFDGVDDLVTVADAFSLDLKAGMTLEAWVNPGTMTGWETAILKERGPEDFSYSLYAHDGGSLPGGAPVPSGNLRAQGAHRTLRGVSQLPAGVWKHVATTYDGTTQRLFIDGVQVSSRAQTGDIEVGNGALRIGGNTSWETEFFQGAIDEVRVYNRALSAAEIMVDMNGQ